MRKAYRKPTVFSQNSFETSALACAKVNSGTPIHYGAGSTFFSGHSFGSMTFSHTPGTGGNTWHVPTGMESLTTLDCEFALMSS